MPAYLYRRGNGNEGNFIRSIVTLADGECPFAALRALIVNDYIPGKSRRRWIASNLEIDGDEINTHAVIYEGPHGETDFGAAWLTAELQQLDEKDAAYYRDTNLQCWDTLRGALDRGAWKLYSDRVAART